MTDWFAASYITLMTLVNAVLFLLMARKIDVHLAEMANQAEWVHLMLKDVKCDVCRDLEGMANDDG